MASTSTSTTPTSTSPPTNTSTSPPLAPQSILNTLYATLYQHKKDPEISAEESPSILLATQSDTLYATLHAILTNLGFRLIGLGESNPLPKQSSTTSTTTNTTPNALPEGWNATGESYSLRYRHEQSSLTFLLKALKMGDSVLVHGMAVEDGKLLTLPLNLSDYLTGSNVFTYPYTTAHHKPLIPSSTAPSPLGSLFTSMTKLQDLANKFKTTIVQNWIPGLQKEGYQESTTTTTETSSSSQPTRTTQPPYFHPLNPDLERRPRPYHPDYEDPLRARFEQPPFPRHPPSSIGDVDLDPLAASPGLIFPGPRGIGGFGGIGGGMGPGGGMFVGPDHPMFTGGGGVGGFGGPPAGPERLPPGAVPPGARFDPIGPYGPAPHGIPGRGGRGGGMNGNGRGRGRGAGPISGEPDNDELPPPGYHDMFL